MTAQRYIVKCKVCKAATSVLHEGPVPEVGVTGKPHAERIAIARATTGLYRFFGALCLNCRSCGAPKYAKLVKGTYNPDKKCSPRCQSATGFNCECACAGKNHGAAHTA